MYCVVTIVTICLYEWNMWERKSDEYIFVLNESLNDYWPMMICVCNVIVLWQY